jgi:hypothetical protein
MCTLKYIRVINKHSGYAICNALDHLMAVMCKVRKFSGLCMYISNDMSDYWWNWLFPIIFLIPVSIQTVFSVLIISFLYAKLSVIVPWWGLSSYIMMVLKHFWGIFSSYFYMVQYKWLLGDSFLIAFMAYVMYLCFSSQQFDHCIAGKNFNFSVYEGSQHIILTFTGHALRW